MLTIVTPGDPEFIGSMELYLNLKLVRLEVLVSIFDIFSIHIPKPYEVLRVSMSLGDPFPSTLLKQLPCCISKTNGSSIYYPSFMVSKYREGVSSIFLWGPSSLLANVYDQFTYFWSHSALVPIYFSCFQFSLFLILSWEISFFKKKNFGYCFVLLLFHYFSVCARRVKLPCQPSLPDYLEVSEDFKSWPVMICFSVGKTLDWNLKARIRHLKSSIYSVLENNKEKTNLFSCSFLRKMNLFFLIGEFDMFFMEMICV